MIRNKALWLTIAFSLVIFSLTGCYKKMPEAKLDDDAEIESAEDEAQKPSNIKHDNKIKISMRNPRTLNPILNMDESVDKTLKIIFDTLVDFNDKDMPVPNLAKSWKLEENGSLAEIKIDTSIKWHDGTNLSAEDVVFSIRAIQEAEDSPYKPCVENIISYTATSNDTVNIVYREAFSGYAHRLYFPIIPAHIEDISKEPIGTGAYVFESFQNKKHMILTKNTDYFKGNPSISEIEVVFTPDSESELYSFDQGLIDVVNTNEIDWEKHAKNKKSNISEYPTLNYEYIGINLNRPNFQDVEKRQALLYATNREYLLEQFYLYHGQVVDVPVAPQSWLYDEEARKYDSNVNKAKELLAGEEVHAQLLVNKDNKQRLDVAKALKKMYMDIGVTLEIIQADEEEFMEKLEARQFDLFLGGWDLSIIPDLSFALHSAYAGTGTNYSNYKDDEMDSLLGKTYSAMTDEHLQEGYFKIQEYFSDNLPHLSLYFRTAALITNNKIKGDINPHHINVYQNIHNWYID